MGCVIPNEYQEVEYIESTGTQWIDTGLVGNINREWIAKFSDFDRNGIQYAGPFGITENNAKTAIVCGSGAPVYSSFGNKTDVTYQEESYSYLVWATSDIKKISISKNGVYRNDVQRISAFTNLTYAESATTMPLFARKPNANTVDRLVKMKLYSFVCKEEGIYVGNFIPCYRKSDNEIGMYDTVSKQFFTNQGTGTFLKGNDVYHSNVFDLLKTKKKIITNQPHIETLTGDIVSFATDMKAPLKECKVSFMPVQEGSGDPSPSNVRNISGWDGVNVKQCKKNLIIEDDPLNPSANYGHNSTESTKYSEEEQGFYDAPPGVSYTAHATGKNGLSYDKVKLFIAPSDMTVVFSIEYKNVGTTYGIRLHKNSSRLTDIHGNADSTWHRYSQVISLSKGDYLKLLIYDKIYWRNIQVEIANSVTDYESYQGTTYSVDWTNDAGTVYGGYVDLVKGELVATHLAFVMDGTNYTVNTGGAVNATTNMARAYSYIGGGGIQNLPEGKSNTGIYASNKYVIHGLDNGYADSATEGVYCGTGKPYVRVVVNADNLSDVSSASAIVNSINEWLQSNPVQICYQLAEPITYQLTPQQLITLKGQNNLWADTNGTTEIKFWKH